MDYGLLNLGSLLFGVIALILPVLNVVKHNKAEHENWFILSIASVSSCAISLCMQIYYGSYSVQVKDWSALLDTSSAVAFASSVLLLTTVTLNAITIAMYSRSSRK